jgi:hypothetical protein
LLGFWTGPGGSRDEVPGGCAGPHERLDLEVLLQRLEEQLDLPAVLVDRRDRRGAEGQVVRQEDQRLVPLGVVDLDPAQLVRALLRGPRPRQADALVPLDPPLRRDRPRRDHLIDGGVLQPGDEPHALGRQLAEPGIVHVPAVHHQDRPGREPQRPRHPDVVPLPLGDDDQAGQVAVVVEQAVELDRALGAPELGPVEEGRAQIDHRRVEADQLVLEAELPPALGQGLAPQEQRLEHRPVELPRAMLVGVGQGRAAGGGDPEVLELAFAAPEAAADLPQRVGAPELAEEHGHELPPAGEPPSMPFSVRPLDQRLELGARKQLEPLAEHAAESTHG